MHLVGSAQPFPPGRYRYVLRYAFPHRFVQMGADLRRRLVVGRHLEQHQLSDEFEVRE
jgi:hypothetical protein